MCPFARKRSLLFASLTLAPCSAAFEPVAMMDAVELEMPHSGGRVLLTGLLCSRGSSGRLPAATADLPVLAASPPRTFEARPWIAVHEPPKESSRDGSLLGRDFLGLAAGLVREGYLLGIAGDPD